MKQRDAERTRAELLAEATRAFAEAGFAGTRVEEIARRSGITKRMIYYYFGSKDGLYLAVLEHAYRGIRAAEQTVQIDDLGPAAALRQLAELTYDHHVQHSDFIRLVASENLQQGRFMRQLESLRELGVPALGVLEQILTTGRDAGVFRSGIDPLDVHVMMSAYCVFQVANQHTFGSLFGVDLLDPARRAHFRSLIGEVIVGWITPSPAHRAPERPTG